MADYLQTLKYELTERLNQLEDEVTRVKFALAKLDGKETPKTKRVKKGPAVVISDSEAGIQIGIDDSLNQRIAYLIEEGFRPRQINKITGASAMQIRDVERSLNNEQP